MITISPIQEKVLTGLWIYKFLTSVQAWRFTGNRNLQSIYNDVRYLREKGYLDSIVYWGVSRTGTMHKLHYLTAKGASLVSEMQGSSLDAIKYPKSTNTLVKNDFLHRIATIDMRLSYDEWIANTQFDPLFFDVYFDKIGGQKKGKYNTLKSQTRIDTYEGHHIDPDAIFAYDDTETIRLFLLEVANGYDTQRILKQIRNVTYATYDWVVSDKYNIQVTPKILITLEHPSTFSAVIEKANQDPYLQSFKELENYLFFSLQAEVKKDRMNKRYNLKGVQTNIRL